MKKLFIISLISIFSLYLFQEIHVSNNGNDNPNCGSQNQPCKTIIFSISKTSDTIILENGVYKGKGNINIEIKRKNINKKFRKSYNRL